MATDVPNVLVVDDSSSIRSIVARTIKICALPIGEIYEASNGQEGLEVLAREQVGIVLVDINMPVMGGLEMIDRIREKPELASLPIVVVSVEWSESRMSALRGKGVKFVHKPFEPEEIGGVLTGILAEMNDAGE